MHYKVLLRIYEQHDKKYCEWTVALCVAMFLQNDCFFFHLICMLICRIHTKKRYRLVVFLLVKRVKTVW